MAINIDTVYQRVLALANKEQRGYITPQEFNLLANQAQMGIFEEYFHHLNQYLRNPGNNSNFSDSLDYIEDKISMFEVERVPIEYVPAFNLWLPDGGHVIPLNDAGGYSLYRLVNVYIGGGYNREQFLLDELPREPSAAEDDASGANRPPVANPDPVRPDIAQADYGSRREDEIILNRDIRELDDVEDLRKLRRDLKFPPNRRILRDVTLCQQKTFKEIRQMASATYSARPCVHSPIYTRRMIKPRANEDGVLVLNIYSDSNHIQNDQWYLDSNGIVQTQRSNSYLKEYIGPVLIDYIKKPSKANWNYVVVNEKALYNSGGSNNFDLHPSEETNLVYKILELSGIIINKPGIADYAKKETIEQSVNEKS